MPDDRTVPCPDCGSPVRPDVDPLCPSCGYPLMFLRTVAKGEDARAVPRAPGERDDTASGTAPVQTRRTVRPPRTVSAPTVAGQVDCPQCGHGNEAARIRCERCGYELRDARPVAVPLPPPAGVVFGPRRRRRWIAVAAGAAVALVLAVSAVLALRGADDAPTGGPGADPTTATALLPVDLSTVRASASSTIPGKSRRVQNTLDGDLQTVWNSDGKRLDSNVGVKLTYRFDKPVVLARITVVNGSAKNATSFAENQRIARLRVRTDTASTVWSLADTMKPQSLALAPAVTDSVTFEVEKVYGGTRWTDLALTDVSFDRRA